MTDEQIIEYIRKAKLYINVGFTHNNYEEKEKLRNFYLQALTGENIEELLPQFEIRETPNLWEQRKAVTIENISPITARVLNYFYKVSRTPKNKYITCEDERKNKILAELASKFYADSDIEEYLTQTIDITSIIDPNAFLAIAVKPFEVGQTPKPYPIIFDCTDVKDFGYKSDGLLEYLFCCINSKINKRDVNNNLTTDIEEISDYYLFLEGRIINFLQESKNRPQPYKVQETWVSNKNKKYWIVIQETGTKNKNIPNRVQAIPLGYIKHKSKKMVYVSPLQPAKPILREMIRRKSGLDLSIENHVHPQLFMYSEPCPGEIHISDSRKCINGRIAGTKDEVCTVCNGDGLKPIRSAQEYIKVPLPKATQANIPIDKWAYYNSPDIKPVEYLDKRINQLESAVLQAVFNTDHTQRYNGQGRSESQTATEVFLKRDSINNTLKPFADHRATIYRFIGQMFGIFLDVKAECVYEYTTEKFEPVTFEELIATLKALMDAGADEILIDEIQHQLAVIALDNDQEKIRSYKIRRKHLPFKGKSIEQINKLISLSIVPIEQKILWANFANIWDRLEAEYGRDLYNKGQKEIIKLINEEVDKIKKLTDDQNPTNQLEKGLTISSKFQQQLSN